MVMLLGMAVCSVLHTLMVLGRNDIGYTSVRAKGRNRMM